MAVEFTPGVYEHYKGGTYLAMSVAYSEQSLEPMVVYIQITDKKFKNPKALQFVRPLKEWSEVIVTGESKIHSTGKIEVYRGPRFKLLRPLGP